MRLLVVVAVFAILGLLSPVFARYVREIVEAVGGGQFEGMIPEPTVGDAVVQFTKNIGQFGVLIAILVTMGSVAAEKERGTAAFLLTKPIGRGAFVTAKVVAIGALLAVGARRERRPLLDLHRDPLRAAPGGRVRGRGRAGLALPGGLRGGDVPRLGGDPFGVVGGRDRVRRLRRRRASSRRCPAIGPYMPTSLWGAADELALGTVPDPLAGPVLANVAFIAGGAGRSPGGVFRRQEL